MQLNVHKYILIVCIYMPCDTYSNISVSTEYENCINCLEELLSQYAQDDNIFIICGDWNTSFERDTYQTRFMSAFLERNEFCLSWHHPMAYKSNTYVNHNLHHESCIDHFVVSNNVYGNIRQNNVNDTPLNPATHCPVMLVFDISYLTRFNKSCHPSQRPRWQVDKEAIGLSRVQQCSSTYNPPSCIFHSFIVLCENECFLMSNLH